jgi:RNA polymerase sigma-70 factor (ECF subfamily)
MAAGESFDEVVAGLRAGDPQAAAEVFRRFGQRLLALARSRLDALVRQKEDPEDVLQSALKSFFLRQAAGQFDLDSWDSLWSLLTVITLRKCGLHVRHFRAARRDLRREVPPSEDSAASWEPLAREPTPSEAAVLGETVTALLRGLEGRDREIVSLALQGYNGREIGERLQRPERTVYRVLERVKKRLRRMEDEGAEAP